MPSCATSSRHPNLDVASLAVDDPATRVALSQLRRECVDAKEALSFDTEATIPVLVPRVQTTCASRGPSSKR